MHPPAPRPRHCAAARDRPAAPSRHRAARRVALLAPLAALLAACTQTGGGGGGLQIPSVATEIVIKDAVVEIGELRLKLLLTPAQVESLAQAMNGGGGNRGGGTGSGG